MNTALTLLSILLSVVLLWAGIKKLHFSTHLRATLTFLDVLLLIGSVIVLGWLGFALVMGANALGFIATGVRLFMQTDTLYRYAAHQCDSTPEELRKLDKELRHSGEDFNPFSVMGPVPRAQLICRLAERHRSVDEMRSMARPIALLWVGQHERSEVTWLVDAFDQLMRAYNLTPENAITLADMIAGTTKASAATFREIVEAMVAAVDADARAGDDPFFAAAERALAQARN
jgi:hypothetical protein